MKAPSRITALLACLPGILLWNVSVAQSVLVFYPFDADATRFTPVVIDENVAAGNLNFGAGVSTIPATTSGLAVTGRSLFFSNSQFYSPTMEISITAARWLEFSVQVNEGYEAYFSELVFHTLRRAQNEAGLQEALGAPQAFAVFSSADGYAEMLAEGVLELSETDQFTEHRIGLSGSIWLQRVTGWVTFRIVLWSPEGVASPNQRVWRLDDMALSGVVVPIPTRPPCPASLFVSPDGDDDNPGTEELPFASLIRARDALREQDCDFADDVVINVAPGDYLMGEPLVLTPLDAGRGGFRVIYRAIGTVGSARLIGGVPLTGWEPVDGNVFRAKVDEGHAFHTLYENGVRAVKARFPNREYNPRFPLSTGHYLEAENGTSSQLTWKPGDLDPIAGMDLGEDLALVVWPWGFRDWHKTPRKVQSINWQDRTIGIDDIGVAMEGMARYYLEGALGFLDQPGEFHLDADGGYLYYWPRFGTPSEQEIIAPMLRRIISIEGGSALHPVTGVVIEGFTLAYTDAFAYMQGATMFPWSQDSVAPHGTLHLRYTEDVDILNNHIKGSGMNGIYLDRSNKRGWIHGNLVEDSGVSGIVLGYHRQALHMPDDINADNLIENNLIRGMGSIAVDSAGINIWGGRNNIVRHCDISEGARYGVSIRGGYGQMDLSTRFIGVNGRHHAENNRIEHTRMYRLAQDSGDAAAMHMAGISGTDHFPVNFLEQLLIENIIAHPTMKDMPPEGIYFDYTEGVTNQVLRNVEVRGTPNPFRTNRTDFGHTYDNVSWREGFDSSLMDYAAIGLQEGFPESFRLPAEVSAPQVEFANAAPGKLLLQWNYTGGSGPAEVVITAEGVTGYAEVRVPGSQTSVEIDRPAADRLVMLRLRAVNAGGLYSEGVLVPAAPRPAPVSAVSFAGIDTGFRLAWRHPDGDAMGYRVAFADPNIQDVDVAMGVTEVEVTGLVNHRTYPIRVDVVDAEGNVWTGTRAFATAGVRAAAPDDAVAHWAFDSLSGSGQYPDLSGNDHPLSRVNGVSSARRLGDWAAKLDGKSGHLVLDDAEDLRIGTGHFAVSMWIRRSPSTAMRGRILDFGGGTYGSFEHWDIEPPAPVPGLNIFTGDYNIGARLYDGSRTYTAQAGGVQLTNRWYHIVVNIVRNDSMTLWIDGQPAGSVRVILGASQNITTPGQLYLGRAQQIDHPNLYWAGKIHQVRIYQRSLSNAEIGDLFAEFASDTRLGLPIESGEWNFDPRFGLIFGVNGGWGYSPFLGWVNWGHYPLLYQAKIGWIVYMASAVDGSIWFYNHELGWIMVPPVRDGSFLHSSGNWTEGSFFPGP